ncbi:hypothetical protein AB1I63_02625 [Streptococcus pneumoniae]
MVNQLLRFLGKKKAVSVIILCYLFGSIETYSAYLVGTPLFEMYQAYARIFITSRNGIFYAPLFIFLGYLLYDNFQADFFKKQYSWKLLGCFGILGLEHILVFLRQGLDKNFFLGLAPFVVFLFNAVIRTSLFSEKNFSKLRKLSMLYFSIHPIFIEWTAFVVRNTYLSPATKGKLLFFISFLGTHLVSEVILAIRNWRIRHANRVS